MSVTSDEVLRIFKDTGALLEGHFVYSSGRHGRHFLQAARVLQFPQHTERLCRALAEPFRDANVSLVAGPATGGIILAYETARHLQCRAVYTEKDDAGNAVLRRGFALTPGTRVLVVEDIVTTGGSVKKAIEHLRSRDAEIVAVATLIDRSGGRVSFDCPFHSLATVAFESYAPDDPRIAELAGNPVDPDELMG